MGFRDDPNSAADSHVRHTGVWPDRGHYLLLAIAAVCVAVYGSLVPLDYKPLPLTEAIKQFLLLGERPTTHLSRSDLVVNVLLFIPIGYCFLAVALLDRRGWWRTLVSLLTLMISAACISVSIEFAQLWVQVRTASHFDILAQIFGNMIGIGLWMLTGQVTADWLRSYTASMRHKNYLDWILRGYFLAVLLYWVLPLDLATSPNDLVNKYRLGRIHLRPFTDFNWDLQSVGQVLLSVVLSIPVGMLAATAFTPPERPVRRMLPSLILGGILVATIYGIQFLVVSRVSSTTHLILAILGMTLGIGTAYWWRGAAQVTEPSTNEVDTSSRLWLLSIAAAIYALVLVIVFCAPLRPIHDTQVIQSRLALLGRAPLTALYHGSALNAVKEVLRKGMFFAPMGALLTLIILQLGAPRAMRRILFTGAVVMVALLGFAIEVFQVVLPPHVPDLTDVLLYTAGAVVGMMVMLRLLRHRSFQPEVEVPAEKSDL